MHRRYRRTEFQNKLDALLGCQRLEQRQHRANQRIGIQRQPCLRQWSGGAAQLLDDLAGAERLAGNSLDDAKSLQGVFGVATQQRGRAVCVGGNGRERLIQFMGKAGRQFAQHMLVGANYRGCVQNPCLRARVARLIIGHIHVDIDPKPLPENAL